MVECIAVDDHRDIRIMPGDTVIFSASPIPGNELTVSRTINNLYRRGAQVITRRRGTDTENIHVSGHASKEEIRDMLGFVRPQYCVPLHGEYRNLMEFRTLAREIRLLRQIDVVFPGNAKFRESFRDGLHRLEDGTLLLEVHASLPESPEAVRVQPFLVGDQAGHVPLTSRK